MDKENEEIIMYESIYEPTLQDAIKKILDIKAQTGHDVVLKWMTMGGMCFSTEFGNNVEEIMQVSQEQRIFEYNKPTVLYQAYMNYVREQEKFDDSINNREVENKRRVKKLIYGDWMYNGKELTYSFDEMSVTFCIANGNFEQKIKYHKDTNQHKEGDIVTVRGKEAVLDFLNPYVMENRNQEITNIYKYNEEVSEDDVKKLEEYIHGIEERIQEKLEEYKNQIISYEDAIYDAFKDVYKDIENIPELEDFEQVAKRKRR